MGVLSDKLALRYFKKRIISWLAVLAVGVSVFITLVVMTVMNGLANEFKEKNHSLFGDCIISTDSLVGFAYYRQLSEKLAAVDCVRAISPVIISSGLISVDGATGTEGVDIMGIEPGTFCEVTRFTDTLYPDSFDSPAEIFDTDVAEVGCIRGIAMMNRRDAAGQYRRNLSYDIELELSCFPLTPAGTLAKSGTDLVNTKRFIVTNDSNSGLPRIDRSTLYIPFEHAQLLCGMAGAEPRANAIFIAFNEGYSFTASISEVEAVFDDFKLSNADKPHSNLLENVRVESWKQYRRDAIAPIEKEEIMLTAMFVLIGVVTVFVILVVFFLIISHKSRDVGLFKSFGVSTFGIIGIFMRFAFAAGLTGATIGTFGAIAFLRYINDIEAFLYAKYGWQLWDRAMYSIEDIPNDVRPSVVITIAACAILAALSGAIIPVVAASIKQPADTLRVSRV